MSKYKIENDRINLITVIHAVKQDRSKARDKDYTDLHVAGMSTKEGKKALMDFIKDADRFLYSPEKAAGKALNALYNTFESNRHFNPQNTPLYLDKGMADAKSIFRDNQLPEDVARYQAYMEDVTDQLSKLKAHNSELTNKYEFASSKISELTNMVRTQKEVINNHEKMFKKLGFTNDQIQTIAQGKEVSKKSGQDQLQGRGI
jgi:hypothetical protein